MAVQVNPKTPFEDYWRELSKVVPNLSGRRGMERLNRVRVNLKHHGSIPGIQQIADARTDVDAFLAANTQAVFGVDYDTVTMADVVPQKPVRIKIRAAAEAVGDRQEAMGLLAEAFDELFNPQHHALRRAVATIVRQDADVAHPASRWRGCSGAHVA
jgi:hypothetical protein